MLLFPLTSFGCVDGASNLTSGIVLGVFLAAVLLASLVYGSIKSLSVFSSASNMRLARILSVGIGIILFLIILWFMDTLLMTACI